MEPAQLEIAAILAPLDRGAGASDAQLAALAADLAGVFPAPLPDDYVAFLRYANGADGTLSNGVPIVLWEAETILEANADTVEGGWMPGCLLVGSDSGDFLYGIDLRTDAMHDAKYIETEDVGIAWDYLLWSGPSFLALLRYLNRGES